MHKALLIVHIHYKDVRSKRIKPIKPRDGGTDAQRDGRSKVRKKNTDAGARPLQNIPISPSNQSYAYLLIA